MNLNHVLIELVNAVRNENESEIEYYQNIMKEKSDKNGNDNENSVKEKSRINWDC